MRALPIVVMAVVMGWSAVGCADEDFSQDVQSRWCELASADCAPPAPLQPPVLNQPEDGVPASVIPPIYPPADR